MDAYDSVFQPWLRTIPMMQQTVLMTAVRGPDGLPKYHASKWVLRWYRRCVLLSSIDHKIVTNPYEPTGGSFTGPSLYNPGHHDHDARFWTTKHDDWRPGMSERVSDYIASLDEVPLHFHLHFVHAVEILGYKHPNTTIRGWWLDVYMRLVNDMHLFPETMAQMDSRLGDDRSGWLARTDRAVEK